MKLLGSNSSVSAYRSRAARPASAARSPPGATIPAYQSMSVVNGAIPPSVTAATTRSGSRAAQASACGPPPEAPMTAKRSMPRASTTCATSSAADATVRPRLGLEPP